jgi:hypothetical protein
LLARFFPRNQLHITPVDPRWTPVQQNEWMTAFNFYTTDVVSIHAPLTPATDGLIGTDQLEGGDSRRGCAVARPRTAGPEVRCARLSESAL